MGQYILIPDGKYGWYEYRGTSLIKNSPPLGPHSRAMPRALWWS